MSSSNEYGSSSPKGPASGKSNFPADAAGRLIDEILDYLRARHQREAGTAAEKPVDEDRVLRAAIHQVRKHPLPTALLGISAIWLLLADEAEEKEADSHWGRKLEDEVAAQIKGGYTYTGNRLRELVDQYPWAAAGVLAAGGLGAALLLSGKRRRVPVTHEEPGAFAAEPSPRDEFDLGSSGDEGEPLRE